MKNNSILDSLKKIYTKMTGKKVVKRKTETDVLSDIAESYNPNQGGGSSYTAGTGIDITNNEISIDDTVVAKKSDLPDEVSGTNDGTNWTSLTIGNTTKAIPQGGSGGSGNQYLINYEEFADYIIGKHLSVDALIDLFEDKGIDDTLITNCQLVSLTAFNLIGISVECDAEMYVVGRTIPLTNTGATGIIDAVIAKKNDIEAYTYSLENITEWYFPTSKGSNRNATCDTSYVGQCSMSVDYQSVGTFYKFTATTLDELKALFVETV